MINKAEAQLETSGVKKPALQHQFLFESKVDPLEMEANGLMPLMKEINQLEGIEKHALVSAMQIPMNCLAAAERIVSLLMKLHARVEQQHQQAEADLRRAQNSRDLLRGKLSNAKAALNDCESLKSANALNAIAVERLKSKFDRDTIATE